MSGFSPAYLVAIWQAETIKLMSRRAARVAILLSIVLGLAGPALLTLIMGTEFEVNGSPFGEWLGLVGEAPAGQLWALEIRNFILLPIFVMWLSAVSVAGEFRSGTLREDLVRPVPRAAVFLAKWGALTTWIALTLALTWVAGGVAGPVAFGFEGRWGQVALGYLATLPVDACIAAITLTVAISLRNVPASLVGMVLVWVVSIMTSILVASALLLLNADFAVQQLGIDPWYGEMLALISPWLPSEAIGAWAGAAERSDWVWQHFASLGLMTTASLGLGAAVFQRTDVP